MSCRGIPGQIRKLIDTMKNDTVSLTYAQCKCMHCFVTTTYIVHDKTLSLLHLYFFLTLILTKIDGEFWEWLEAGDPLHRRQWPVSVLQWPGELLWEVVIGNDIFKALPSVKSISCRITVVKQPVVSCDALCRAVSWYHCPNGTSHWSRIIKLCEQPSPNCFIVSE